MDDPARQVEDEGRGGPSSRWRNVGGTRGGIGEFLIGLALLIAGGYLFLDNVVVSGNFWSLFGFSGFSSFGLMLIPFFIGVALLFFSGRSIVGWLLTGGSLVAIVVGVISQLHVFFKPTSLLNTLGMFVLMAAGVGLLVRSLRAH
jgi:hypothetical protein